MIEPRTAGRLGALWCLLLAAAAFFPFNFGWRGPRKLATGLERAANGAATFDGPSVLRTEGPPAWLRSAIEAQALTVLVEARTAAAGQQGPARLVTISAGAYQRNLTIAQKGVDLVVRARRPGADGNGAPPLKVDEVFDAPRWVQIEVRVTPRRIDVFVDGEKRAWEKTAEPAMALWDPDFLLGFGDEVDGARGWNGTIRSATAAIGDEVHDLLADPHLVAPEELWHVPEPARRLLRWDSSWWLVIGAIHLAAFFPLGALLFLGAERRRTLASIALSAALFGGMVQLGKLAFDGRHPSLFHMVPNGIGAALGAAWVRRREGRA